MAQGWLLDTSVLSETVRREPHGGVMAWLDGLDPEQLHISVLSVGELHKGALMAADARRRERLAAWIAHTLPDWFGERVLPIDREVATRWAEVLVAAGRSLPVIDSLLAATALAHGLGLATRNVRDFEVPGLRVLSPWDA